MLQKQANEKKKIAMTQQDITAIETATTKDGELYTEVTALFNEKEEFLNKEITPVMIKEAKDNLLKKQTEIETLKREYSKKINASVAEDNIQLLQKKIVLASNKLEIQT